MDRVFMCFPGFKAKAVTLSYDDGVRQDKRLISIMKENGLKGTFNINGGQFSSTPSSEEKGRMTVEEATALYDGKDFEVAIHGYKHLSVACIDKAVATNDVIQDRVALEKVFGKVIKGMAYANGSFDEDVSILKTCGVEYCRTTVSTESFDLPKEWLKWHPTCRHKDPKLFELVETFLNSKDPNYFWFRKPMLFYLWGHSYEFNDKDNWQVFEEFAEYIGNREDVWYATNGEIYDYIKAYDSLEFSVDGKMIYNPTCQDVYICYFEQNILVRSGESVVVEKLL